MRLLARQYMSTCKREIRKRTLIRSYNIRWRIQELKNTTSWYSKAVLSYVCVTLPLWMLSKFIGKPVVPPSLQKETRKLIWFVCKMLKVLLRTLLNMVQELIYPTRKIRMVWKKTKYVRHKMISKVNKVLMTPLGSLAFIIAEIGTAIGVCSSFS